ncbi:MAG: hypothetical protein Q9157_008694 [Trypethelium eluteriae]
MFPSFTGNSRRPRQVNLSGRNPNPFATPGSAGGQNVAVVNAQQERIQRQKERERLHAAKTLQRTWRGHNSRAKLKSLWRTEWDAHEHICSEKQADTYHTSYDSAEDSLMQLRLLAHFFDPRSAADVRRLLHYFSRTSWSSNDAVPTSAFLPMAFLKLENHCLRALDHRIDRTSGVKQLSEEIDALLEALWMITEILPHQTALNADKFYHTLARFTRSSQLSQRMSLFQRVLISPLRKIHSETFSAYEGFISKYLIILNLHEFLNVRNGLEELADHVNIRLLAKATADVLSRQQPWELVSNSKFQARLRLNSRERLALLTNFIFFHRKAHNFTKPEAYSGNDDFVAVVSKLLSSLADEIDIEARTFTDSSADVSPQSFDEFTQAQLISLVNQESIGGMLRSTQNQPARPKTSDADSVASRTASTVAQNLAGFALTLLRLFPLRGDEIRMWLYLGSTDKLAGTNESATKFFWDAVRQTHCFRAITRDSKTAFNLLKPRSQSLDSGWQPPRASEVQADDLDDEWRLIFTFMELYTFMLKVMDDEEFFSRSHIGSGRQTMGTSSTRQNALPLTAIQELSTFLKNLGFTLYFNGADLSKASESAWTSESISNYFKHASSHIVARTPMKAEVLKKPSLSIAGLAGISVDYVKGLTTGLLRMIYERDSRRKFLPDDHWLMTSRFDMDSFIPAVVEEEENRSRLDAEDDGEEDWPGEEREDAYDQFLQGITSRTPRIRQVERLRTEQRKLSRQRYLQAVAPRLEILQNMPFLIPFTTRVQIFREFVHLDQIKRRNGYTDPDTWRMAMHSSHRSTGENELSHYHAKVRRKHEFDDAYEQFYSLGSALKEPIQITFVDQFDTVEAGIDGGGVTKEFLTSVTSEAFSPSDGIDFFVENDQHLLYPNPTVVEEKKELLRGAGVQEGTTDWRNEMSDMMQRYEFLGRIVGKCLYEGILVDIGFAGFFLLKWALTGGSGSAPNESGYRANLNDLRDLDEELYQGLLQLKNYPGDVEDFSLNFSVTDNIPLGNGRTTTLTRELKPDGANTPVTNENRLVYISYMARYRLSAQPLHQTNAFLRGLASIIQPSWLSMFNQSELQTLIGGARASIDIADLRRHTQYGGVYVIGNDGQEHPSVRLFWRVMESLNDRDRAAVLKFVTSTPRAPLLGFASLNPKFSIRDAGDDQERLPSTSTCVNLLKLPRFTDERVLREKLLYAVNSGAGFDLS